MSEFRTLSIAKEYYKLGKTEKLPTHLKDQFLRASSSVALNLSEGNAKTSRKDRLRIFEIAYGSFRESQTILELGGCKNDSLYHTGDTLGACLYKLIFALKKLDNKGLV